MRRDDRAHARSGAERSEDHWIGGLLVGVGRADRVLPGAAGAADLQQLEERSDTQKSPTDVSQVVNEDPDAVEDRVE